MSNPAESSSRRRRQRSSQPAKIRIPYASAFTTTAPHLLRKFATAAPTSSNAQAYRHRILSSSHLWETLDRSQVLGDGVAYGHLGCVNALCWRDDGGELMSGSDDQRLCFWRPSGEVAAEYGQQDVHHHDNAGGAEQGGGDGGRPTARTPHPLSLHSSIVTGHQANIFSAKYLPNASSVQVVSCAGDAQVRVFDVERLNVLPSGQQNYGRSGRRRVPDINGGWRAQLEAYEASLVGEMRAAQRTELDGRHGEGVRVIRCHTDRVKRISTEDNPSVFLTVSEDGTVRQHDLRTTHQCQRQCPPPLMEAPAGISLYTLSVSKLNPYLFTVAGTSPYAYLQDRRMVRLAAKEWGPQQDQEGNVQCVRRFGLSPADEDAHARSAATDGRAATSSASEIRRRRRYNESIRHITAVQMSEHVAEDLIVSFSGLSVALYSIHDPPAETSARAHHQSVLLSSTKRHDKPSKVESPARNKRTRPHSEVDESSNDLTAHKSPRIEIGDGNAQDGESGGDGGAGLSGYEVTTSGEAEAGRSDFFRRLVEAEESIGRFEDGHSQEPDNVDEQDMRRGGILHRSAHQAQSDAKSDLSNDDDRSRDSHEPQDGDDNDDFHDTDDEDDYSNDNLDDGDGDSEADELEDEEEEEDDGEDEDGDEEMESLGLYGGQAGERQIYRDVPVVYPRRTFSGARNVETVKDVNFLGVASDKVCSGSDDGNFFVWDKMTGNLEGIWEGDSSVVNVIEQHPTLPLVAVSGIDETVKIFGPQTATSDPTFRRTDLAEQIIRNNTDPSVSRQTHRLNQMQLLRQLLGGGEMDEEGEVPCRVQ